MIAPRFQTRPSIGVILFGVFMWAATLAAVIGAPIYVVFKILELMR